MGVDNWLRRFSQRKHVASAPDGCTDDLSVQLPGGRTVEELVDHILASNHGGRQHETLIAELGTEFGLSNDDAELSVDRVCGGMVPAVTCSRTNCPNRLKDPIAWASFQRTIGKR